MSQTLARIATLAVVCAAFLHAQDRAVRPPRVISQLQAEYSEEARRVAVNTSVSLSLVINENGEPQDIKVVRGAGFGLDEMAIRAIQSWRFEPGTKKGQPYAAPTHIDLRFNLADKARTGQTTRLNFSLPPGVERPELIQGKIPENPDPPAGSMQIRFTVSPEGKPTNFQTLETTNQTWTDRALDEMAGWRFRPATRAGQPEEANGILELTVGHQKPANRPSLTRRLVPITPPEPQDSSLPGPKLISPPDQAVFDNFTRQLTCRWEASPGAVSYLLEWDYMYRDVWHAEAEAMPGTAYEVAGTETSFEFVGAQPGRWRVWPVNSSGQRGIPSEWRTFRFLK
jgi:TonB family protein